MSAQLENQCPKVSVIIPVYNAQDFLDDTIKSVLNQTFKDFELLLVDDGSKDCSPEICDKYAVKDPRVKVFHKPNGGVSSARNLGLDNAKGEFIAFADNDDRMFPEFLETMTGNIAGYDLMLSSFVEVMGGHKYSNAVNSRNQQPNNYVDASKIQEIKEKAKDLNLMRLGVIWCNFFRQSIIKDFSIRFPLTQHEDTIFIYNYLLHCNSIRRIDYQGYMRVYREDSLGHNHKFIAETESISKFDQAFYGVIRRFGITDENLIYKFRWRLRSGIRSFLLKGYYKDTKVPRAERMKRWSDIRKKDFNVAPYFGKVGIVDKAFHLTLRTRLYRILDPFILMGLRLLKR